MTRLIHWSFLTLFLMVAFSGCQRGVRRYEISGQVTYEGAPVQLGEISFDPVEQEVGGGFASIQEGKYNTSIDGRGHLGGPHRVHIVGFQGSFDPGNPDMSPEPLFPPHETTVELPAGSTTMDFDVPADTAK